MDNFRALSIRQPYAEAILRGLKPVEWRRQPTKIRGRIYIYASETPGDPGVFPQLDPEMGRLPRGVLVGTVELTDCTFDDGYYAWHLANPERLAKPVKPLTHPQPVWFYPFEEIGKGGQRASPTKPQQQ